MDEHAKGGTVIDIWWRRGLDGEKKAKQPSREELVICVKDNYKVPMSRNEKRKQLGSKSVRTRVGISNPGLGKGGAAAPRQGPTMWGEH
jgi:hypothetical protein